MRKIAAIAALAAPILLVACAEEAVEEPVVEEEVVEEAAMVTANGTAAGTFSVTAADGTLSTSVLNGDGTYQDIDADGNVTEEGTWEVVDGKSCFTSNAEGAEALCWSEGEPGEDGSFTATSDAGDEVTVSPSAG
ncbi:hypothetical protein OZN62_13555 [Aurantiacibacter sp. MUD11]|uniref:hypothetical protein n=1 Tax=Aurantiacibacter sp. MUD11 TaxID=3003265 RepID=UPI0022AB0242|nr:hypothetical protein [Aurantiacibacter sp. MUD11]WAT17923.1 hypothetical protein OZN62_13555 [Aurantiacibacter sp. MUD11]